MRNQPGQVQVEAIAPAKVDAFVPNYLLYLLASTSDAASSQFHDYARHSDLRAPEWRVLACLNDEEGLMVTRLAELALMEQSRLTKTIDQMNKRGLVERRSDVTDGRRVRVFLTPLGRKMAQNLVEAARQHEAKVLEHLLPGEGDLLKSLLRRLQSGLAGLRPTPE